jgi:formylglycine-generating enzyme
MGRQAFAHRSRIRICGTRRPRPQTIRLGRRTQAGRQGYAQYLPGPLPGKEHGCGCGCAGTSPGGSYKPNGYGLYDMPGNVWEWTSDWYRPEYYQSLASSGPVAINPKGPADSLDPSEPGVPKKVHRGGSFLCTDQYCSRYMVGGRGKGEPTISPFSSSGESPRLPSPTER